VDKGDVLLGLAIAGAIGGAIGGVLLLVYGIITVAKWAWNA